MITIKQEQQIRQCLSDDPVASNRSISRGVGVSWVSVRRVRATVDAVNELGKEKSYQIRKLILNGMSTESIMSEALVSSDAVKSVMFFFFLQKRESGYQICYCPTCGSIMFSDEYKKDSKASKVISQALPPVINDELGVKLYRAVVDIVELDKNCIITNPLFHFLALRAKKILGEIHDESSSDR